MLRCGATEDENCRVRCAFQHTIDASKGVTHATPEGRIERRGTPDEILSSSFARSAAF
jgi:hypothetical protein